MNRIMKQTGLSLIEMMVSMVIAAFLILGLVYIFMSGRASFVTQEQMGRLQENGRYAYYLLRTELQEAGYHKEVWDPPVLGFAMTANTQDGSGTASDTLELQYESDRDCSSAFNTVTVTVQQPDGTNIFIPDQYHKLVRFTVVNNQLIYTCSYGPINGVLVQQINSAIADGVENLQLQYGEDLSGDLSVNRWVNAGGWSNLFDVVAVRVGLVVRTPNLVRAEVDTETYDLYGATTTAANDQRIRRVYAGEISARNLTL